MTRSRNVRSRGQQLVVGLTASALLALLAQGGCAVSDPTEFILLPDAGQSATGGSSNSGTGGGSGGTSSTGGTFATGGTSATGGTNGTGGFSNTGGFTGTGGFTNTGGFTGTGGVLGSGGTRATGGAGGVLGAGGTRATGGTTGSGGSGGSSAATFTQIYQQILTVSCAGSQCHNPGSQGGVSFSSQSNAYSAVKSRVVAGNASGSSFYSTVSSGRMPPSGTKLSSSQLSMISGWINAGALNN